MAEAGKKNHTIWIILGVILLIAIFVIYKITSSAPAVAPVQPPSAANGYGLSAQDLAIYNALPTSGDYRSDFLASKGVLNTLNATPTGQPTPASSSNIFSQLGTDIKGLFGIKSAATPAAYVQVPPIDAYGCDVNGNNAQGQPCATSGQII